MARTYAQQKAALTRALKTRDYDRVESEVRRAVAEWNSLEPPFVHGWPDDWARWNRALQDVGGWNAPDIDDLDA